MAEPTGWGALGNILGGGIDREGAYLEGRYRSAQTEGALAGARKAQADALKQERTNAAIDKVESDPANASLEDWALAGLGADFSAAQTGGTTRQTRGYKAQMVDPATDYATLQRLRAAVGDAPFNPVYAVGTHGAYIDARNPDKAVQPPLGEEFFPSDPTNQMQNYEQLVKLGAPPGPDTFGRVLRADQVINAGGVPTVRTTGTATVAQPVATATVADNAAAVAGGKTTGTGLAKRALDLPRAKAAVAATDAKWNSLLSTASTLQSDENLWSAVGLGQPIASIPGTEGARIRAQINTLKAKVGFAVLQDMRDNSKTGGALGQVSNQENQYLQNALAALDANLAPEDFREQLQILIDYANEAKGRVGQAFTDTYPELSQPAAAAPAAGPAAAPAAASGVKASFATEAEATAAEVAGSLKKGDRVMIGGVTGTWQ